MVWYFAAMSSFKILWWPSAAAAAVAVAAAMQSHSIHVFVGPMEN